MKLTLVPVVTVAAAVGWGAWTLTPARAAEAQNRRQAVRTQEPTVRVVRQSAPPACGQWGSVTIEACSALASCSAQRIGSAQVAPLADAAELALNRHLERSCSGLSCGPSRTRNDTNAFACRGTSRLCYTRTLEFTCLRVAGRSATPPTRTSEPRRTSDPPRRTSEPPQRTADPQRPPTRTATPVAGPPGARMALPADDLMEPIGGSGQAGGPRRTAGPLPTAKASAAPRR